ncbi:MAG: hypothetical protein Q9213_006729 [Squamulea squamosa]
MATYLPRPQASKQPLRHASNSPPNNHRNDATQHERSVRNPADPITQQSVTESKSNGTPAHGNTNVLVPKGPHALATNGEALRRPILPMNGMPFNTARSPPNAKSTFGKITADKSWLMVYCRYFTCALQILPPWSMSGWKGMPLLTFDRRRIHRYPLQIFRKGILAAAAAAATRTPAKPDCFSANTG